MDDGEITSIRRTHVYRSTIIYKICCKDETVEDMYIGHTTNFEKRKFYHSRDSETSLTKVYKFIRSHGGWDNWNMIILANYTCNNFEHACKLEWYWWNKLGGSLNSIIPGIKYIRKSIKINQHKFNSYINDMELSCRKGLPICDST